MIDMSERFISLDSSIIHRFKTGAIFSDNTARTNSLDFGCDGAILCAAYNDDSLSVINTTSGLLQKTLQFKEHGVSNVKFTHHKSAILCTANKSSNGLIMYHSILDNRFIRMFHGHKDRVCSLALSPIDDSFISGSHDWTMNLWDLRSSSPQAILATGPSPAVEFDPKGLIFACTSDSNVVRLFDIRSYKQGPFASFGLSGATSWHQVVFSPDGGSIAVSSRSGSTVVLDSFTGDHRCTLSSYTNTAGIDIDVDFSPDGKFIATGSDHGVVHIYDSASGKQELALTGGHNRPVTAVQWNPVMAMIASGAENLALWIPDS
uniref:Uncharacterized protein n=1 Tax=Spongospora subterranea TaxID=70186 RepID=A0A0H5R8X5_9EUKA|eukprot:CRZ10578.1 hypothetical protein [Spongospora subterranea]